MLSGKHENDWGTVYYFKNLVHRENDQPSIIYRRQYDDLISYEWNKDGRVYRDYGLPSRVEDEGDKITYSWLHERKHRSKSFSKQEGILVIGDKEECQGLCGFITDPDGFKKYHNDVFHRENDQPAVVNGKSKIWYKHGEVHRDHGLPAVVEEKGVYWVAHEPEQEEDDARPKSESPSRYITYEELNGALVIGFKEEI
jgi:hypothetical protein